MRVGRLQAFMFPTVLIVLNVSCVAVLWFGGHRVADGQMQVGALTAYLSYLMWILMSIMMATFMLILVPRASVCAERLTEVLEAESSVVPPAAPLTSVSARGTVERSSAVRVPARRRCCRSSLGSSTPQAAASSSTGST